MFPALAARRKLVLLSDWTTKRSKEKETLLVRVRVLYITIENC